MERLRTERLLYCFSVSRACTELPLHSSVNRFNLNVSLTYQTQYSHGGGDRCAYFKRRL